MDSSGGSKHVNVPNVLNCVLKCLHGPWGVMFIFISNHKGRETQTWEALCLDSSAVPLGVPLERGWAEGAVHSAQLP